MKEKFDKKKFDKLYNEAKKYDFKPDLVVDGIMYLSSEKVVQAISQALTTQKEEFIKIIESKKLSPDYKVETIESGLYGSEYQDGYNQALDDLKAELSQLAEGKKEI